MQSRLDAPRQYLPGYAGLVGEELWLFGVLGGAAIKTKLTL